MTPIQRIPLRGIPTPTGMYWVIFSFSSDGTRANTFYWRAVFQPGISFEQVKRDTGGATHSTANAH